MARVVGLSLGLLQCPWGHWVHRRRPHLFHLQLLLVRLGLQGHQVHRGILDLQVLVVRRVRLLLG